MEESIDSLTQCPFKDSNIRDKVRQCTVEFSLDPPSFEESKNAIISAIQALEDEKTDRELVFEIKDMLIKASHVYSNEIFELFKPKFEKIRSNEAFPNKDYIFLIFVESINAISINNGFPKEKEFVDFYEICYNETKKVSPKFSEIIDIYGAKVPAKSLLRIAVLTQKMDKETIQPFIHVLFKAKFTEIGRELFKRESADFFLECAPFNAYSFHNILELGNEKAKHIIENASNDNIANLSIDFSQENPDYDITLSFFKSAIRAGIAQSVDELIGLIHIQDITPEIIEFCSENRIYLPESVESQITDFSIIPTFLPILETLNFVPDEELRKIITECKDTEQKIKILELSPRCPFLSDVDFWVKLAKEDKSDKWNLGYTMVANIPDINDHVTKFIKELEPNKAMLVLNSILVEHVQSFASFIQKPEYIELLKVTDIPIYPEIAKVFDLSILPFKELNEETPATIWLLIALSSFNRFTLKQPVLPTLTDEEIDAFIEMRKQINQHTYIPGAFAAQPYPEMLKVVKGKSLMKIAALALLIGAAIKQKTLYKGLNETNKLIFMTFVLHFSKNQFILTKPKIFEETDAPLLSIIDVAPDMKEKEILLICEALKEIGNNASLNPFLTQTLQKMYSWKFNDKSKDICIGMARIVINGLIKQVFEENYEQIINCLYEAKISINRCLLLTSSKKEIREFIDNKAKTDDEFRKYLYRGNTFSVRYQNQNDDSQKIIKQTRELSTEALRKEYPIEKILNIISEISSANVGVVENLIVALLRDTETNTHYFQFLLGKTYEKLVTSISFLGNTFTNLFNRPEALAKAIDSLYTQNSVRPDILFQRVRPLELPPPSAFSIELVDAILNFCREKPSFNAYEALFFIAQFNLPLFKFVKMPIKDIFELCFAAKHDSSSFSPFFAAAAFLDNLLEQPQFTDEFFEWVFEKFSSFDEVKVLMATTMIIIKATRRKTRFATTAILMKNSWPQIAAELLEREYAIAKDAIITNVINITTIFYAAMNNMTEKWPLAYQSLMNGEKIFTSIFGFLPMESIFKDFQITNLPFFEKRLIPLFSHRSLMMSNGYQSSVNELNQIIASNNTTPEEEIDPLPASINAEAYNNYSLLLKARVLQQIVFQYKVTPEFEFLAVREEPWVLSLLTQRPNLLLMPSHYLKVLRIIKESEQLEKIEELPSQETIALDFYLQPEIINAVAKIPFEKSQNLIKEMIKNPIMEEALFTNTLECIKTATLEQFNMCIGIISLMSGSENEKETIASELPSILEYCVSNRESIDVDVIKKVFKIIIKENVFPEKIIHLIGFSIISPRLEKFAVEVYTKLPKEMKTEYGYIIEAAFRKALNEGRNVISSYIKSWPELAKTYSSDLLKLADKYLQCNNIEKIDLSGRILSVLSPEPCSVSISLLSAEARAGNGSSLPIPPVVLAQNPDFWKVIQKNFNKIRRIITENRNSLNTAFKFMNGFPTLIPFEYRVRVFRQKLGTRRYFGIPLRITINRNHILDDTFAAIGMLQAQKLRGEIKIKFVGEKGIDAGGLLKEWFTGVIEELFNPDRLLFIPVENKLSYQPNFESSYNNQHLKYFLMTGRIVARAILEGISVPAYFTQGILKCILKHKLTLKDLEVVDKELYRSLLSIRENDVDDIGLAFERTVEGLGQKYTKPLKEGGCDILVTNENKEEYIQLMINDVLYNQTKQQIDAIVTGFHEIIPVEEIKIFNSRELNLLICGLPEVSIDDLEANTQFEHPYSNNSPTIKALFDILRRWDNENRSLFLLFVTGSSKLPVGGFSALEPKFTIKRIQEIDKLPVAHTCFNRLELPDYINEELLESKLLYAIHNAGSFELA